MAGKYTRLQLTYKIDDNEMLMYRGVIQSGAGRCKVPTADNAVPLGVVDNAELVIDALRSGGATSHLGKDIPVKVEGVAEIELSGTCSAGDRIILKTGGFGLKCPAVAGTKYNVLGYAEVNGVDGDVIAVRMQPHIFTA